MPKTGYRPTFLSVLSPDKWVRCHNLYLFYNLLFLPPLLLLIGMQAWIGHDKFSLIQVNHILKIRLISHCVEIVYVFLYLVLKQLDIYRYDQNCNTVYHIYTFVIILYLVIILWFYIQMEMHSRLIWTP